MTNKRKKDFEIKKIKLFLKHFGCRVKSIKKLERDPPDALATIGLPNRKKWQTVAIEETEYFSDAAIDGVSKGQLLYDFWATINRSIVRRIAKHSSLSNVNVSNIRFIDEVLLQTQKCIREAKVNAKEKRQQFDNLTKSIAKELIDLALEFCSADTAPGTTSHNAMHPFPEYEEWNSPIVTDCCKSNVFDRIFFWCGRSEEWHRQIWPKQRR